VGGEGVQRRALRGTSAGRQEAELAACVVGLVAARRIRERYPKTAVVLLSQYLEPRYAQRLLADQPAGLGYLLKERVSDIAVLVDALRRVTEGNASSTPPS
jgi:DNA-binding NarL/FixJ family response regulator